MEKQQYSPKIGYKGFNQDLSCKKEIFEIGKVYYKENKENPKTCSADGYHYCNDLNNVFEYYGKPTDRYCKIEILGNFTDDKDGKSVTTAFRVQQELSKDEIEQIKKEKDESRYADKLGLSTVLEIQKQNPLIQVGGSIALFLHGIRLERFKNGNGDIDLVAPFYMQIATSDELKVRDNSSTIVEEDYEDLEDDDFDLIYSNDFSERLYINGFKVDVKISPTNKYDIIEYNGDKYRVSKLEHIMEAKWRYALEGSLKHKKDCYEISGKK